MPQNELQAIADKADIIVSGYAFTMDDNRFVHILNLENPDCAMMVSLDGDLLATNMDAIEQKIVLGLCEKNLQFLES